MNYSHFILPRALLKALGPSRDGEDLGAIIVELGSAGRIDAVAAYIDDHRCVDHGPEHDQPITQHLWQRISREDKTKDVWDRGTVRLESDTKNYLSYVEIVGIKFEEAQVRYALERFGLALTANQSKLHPNATSEEPNSNSDDALSRKEAAVKLKSSPIRSLSNRETYSIQETIGLTGLGRTTINLKINDGTLDSRKVNRRTLITRTSIFAMLGLPDEHDIDTG